MLQIDAYASYIAAFTVFWRLQWQCDHPSWTASQTRSQKRVSNRVGSPCSARKRVLRVVCAISAAARARGVEKRGPRSEVCHASGWLCLELLSIILGQVEERFTSSPRGGINGHAAARFRKRALSKQYTLPTRRGNRHKYRKNRALAANRLNLYV